MKIILLGVSGQLGWEFQNFLQDKVELFPFAHSDLDILDSRKLNDTFETIKPDVVINCAAYTKVDKAEDESETACKVNLIGAKNVSFAAFKTNSKIVYFSTDYVFDGEKRSPYTEFDQPNPLSIYGKSKFYGELFTEEHNPDFLILRISWLYGYKGSNFVKKIVELSKENKELKVVNDQVGTPNYALDVVKETWKLIQEDRVGLFHSSNSGKTTWFEFANRIVEKLSLEASVVPITSEEFKAAAKRPLYSVLENYLLKLEGLDMMRPWEDAFEDFVGTYGEVLLNGEP